MSAYQDPYYRQHGNPGGDGSAFNPYDTRPPHDTYEQGGLDNYAGGYRDEPFYPPGQSQGQTKERSRLDQDEFDSPTLERRLTKTSRTIRALKYEDENLWTRGGRGRCIGRFCCCTLLVALFLIVSVVLSLLLWIRPPNINVSNVGVPTSSNEIQFTNDGALDINLAVNISVSNPNYFNVAFKDIKAQIFYPINNTAIGSGQENNIDFKSGSNTTFTFPFTIEYVANNDPNHAIITDLATKCGFVGGTKSNINVNYKITLGLKILGVTISPVVSNSLSFACPLQESDIEQILKNSGINLSGLLSGGT